jgi:cell pole-organizing protein PopZ
MDEILASIRQIISTDSDEEDHQPFFPPHAPPQQRDDILDLTNALPDERDHVYISPELQINEWGSPSSPHQDFAENVNEPLPAEEDRLLSESTINETAHAFHLLNKMAEKKSAGEQPLENLVREMLKPLLKEWLDKNLPGIVRSIVTEQVKKIAGTGEGN